MASTPTEVLYPADSFFALTVLLSTAISLKKLAEFTRPSLQLCDPRNRDRTLLFIDHALSDIRTTSPSITTEMNVGQSQSQQTDGVVLVDTFVRIRM